jgi:hypothetical protein
MAKERVDRPRTAADVVLLIDRLLETDLLGDVRAALDAHDGMAIAAGKGRPQAVSNGIIVALVTTAREGGGGVAPPPGLLRRLRAFLGDTSVVAAGRHGARATFGLARDDESVRATRLLPRLIERVRLDFPEYNLGVGVSFGEFTVSAAGAPAEGPTQEAAIRLAVSAHDGEVLIPRETAEELGLRGRRHGDEA